MPIADRRRRYSNALLLVGVSTAFAGMPTGFGGIGPAVLVLLPLPFTGATVLLPSRGRVAAALGVWGCWFFGLWHVLT